MKEYLPHYSIGHFINQPLNLTAFEVLRFEDIAEPEVDDIHRHTFYEIIWIEEGMSRQVIDYQEYELSPGSLFFISPGQVHQFEEWQEIRGGSIFFTEDFFLLNQQSRDSLFELTFLDNCYGQPYLRPDAESFAEMHTIISLLLAERAKPNHSPAIEQAFLHILLAQIQRCIDKSATPSLRKYLLHFKKFKDLIERHFHDNLTASDYAERLSISTHHLNHICRETTGQTATELIRARLILEAKRLLTFTDDPISEIAASLGIFDPSYFTRLFRAETHLSPLAFKKEISEKYRIR